jgi:tape measure domain-containing protein
MAGVNIKVRADARQAQAEMGKLSSSIQNIDKQATQVTKTFRNLAVGIAAVFTGSQITRGINNASDAMLGLQNRVNLVTRDAAKTKVVIDELFKVAARSRSDVGAAADVFNRFGLALQGSGKSAKQLLTVTEAVQKAAVISGSGAASAKAAIIQLGQGLASGQLRGQELNSVLEQMPRLAQAIAKGMGIPFQNLRKEAMAGKITAEAVFQALLDGAQSINDDFLLVKASVADLGVVFKNEFTRALSELDKIVGISADIKSGIMLATQAVRFFGQSIGDWALIASAEFLILETKIMFFIHDFKRLFRSLFSEDFDAKQFVENIANSFDQAKGRVVAKLAEIRDEVGKFLRVGFKKEKKFDAFGDEIVPEKIDLSTRIFTGMSDALSKISTFAFNVIQIFKFLYDKLIGKSLWDGIFKPGHEENPGDMAIGNVGMLGGYLDAATKRLSKWKDAVIGVFSNLYSGTTTQWSNLVKFLTTKEVDTPDGKKLVDTDFAIALQGIRTNWAEFLVNLEEEWSSFYNSISTQTIETPVGFITIDNEFGKSIKSMRKKFSDFKTFLQEGFAEGFLQREVDTPGGKSLVDTDLKIGITTAAKSAVADLKEFGQILANTPAVQAVTISFGGVKRFIDDLVSGLEDNKDRIGTAISLGIAAAIKLGPVRAAFLAALAFNAKDILNDEDFNSSIESLARGAGELLSDVLFKEGESAGESFLDGIGKAINSIGKGFLEGLFLKNSDPSDDPFGERPGLKVPRFEFLGTEILESDLAERLAGSFAVAVGLAFASKSVRSALGKGVSTLGSALIGGSIFGDEKSTKSKKKGGAPNVGRNAKGQFTKLGEGWGSKASRGFNKAFKVGSRAVLVNLAADMIIPDDAFGGLGDRVDEALTAAFLAYTLRSELKAVIGLAFSPVGAAIAGGIVAGLLAYGISDFIVRAIKGETQRAITDSQAEVASQINSGNMDASEIVAAVGSQNSVNIVEKDRNKTGPTDLSQRIAAGESKALAEIQERYDAIGTAVTAISTQSLLPADTKTNQKDLLAAKTAAASLVLEIETLNNLGISDARLDGLLEFERILLRIQKNIGDTLGITPDLALEVRLKQIDPFQDTTKRTPFSQGGSVGGIVNGPGTGTSDDIPAMLSNGEFVMRQSAVQKFGSSFMEAVNAGKIPKSLGAGGDLKDRIEERITGIRPSEELVQNVVDLFVSKQDMRDVEFGEFIRSASGYEEPKRLVGYLGGMASGNNSSENDSIMTSYLNSSSAGGRISNLFTGKADKGVYDVMSAAALSGLQSLATGLSLSVVPGIGTVMGLLSTLPDLVLQPLQGVVKYFRQTTAFGGNGVGGSILDLFTEQKTLGDIKSLVKEPFSNLFTKLPGFNTGGKVTGPGTGTSDDIPAMLSNGEFVMQTSAVQKFGTGFMAAINSGVNPLGFAGGTAVVADSNITKFQRTIEHLGLALQDATIRSQYGNGRTDAEVIQARIKAGELEEQLRELRLSASQIQELIEDPKKAAAELDPGDIERKKNAIELAEGFQEDFKASLSNFLKTGDFVSFRDGLLDSFTSRIIDGVVHSFTDSLMEGVTGENGWLTSIFKGGLDLGNSVGEKINDGVSDSFKQQEGDNGSGGNIFGTITTFFGGMFDTIKNLFSGGGEGGTGSGFGSLIKSGLSWLGIPGMSQGGVVPSTPFSQVGKDSVPILAMPGEVVLSRNDVRNMGNNSSGKESVFNINVSGDVSRQTRQEIVKMMPQIAGGVNAQNKENNYRR